MVIDLRHDRNPALGWDIDVRVTAEKDESVTSVTVKVNGVVCCNEHLKDGMQSWHRLIRQQGQFPGDNETLVEATDQHGNATAAQDEWE